MTKKVSGHPPIALSVSRESIETAPVVYFDGPGSYGEGNGVVRILLMRDLAVPNEDGSVSTLTVGAVNLRCSVVAAVALRDVLDTLLGQLGNVQVKPN